MTGNYRDRLIDLIENNDTYDRYNCELCTKDDNACRKCYAERLADYLLANGAIVPPCKMGDTVYIENRPMLISFLHIENEVTYVVQFDCDDCGDCPFYVDDVSFEGEHDCRTMGYIEFTEKDIGKTVFLTKEEAEQALRGRDKE